MNARQKAKHWKRLYEEKLPKKPYPIMYQSIGEYQHYKAHYSMPRNNMSFFNADDLEEVVCRQLLSQLKPLVKKKMERFEDPEMGSVWYDLDIYMRI